MVSRRKGSTEAAEAGEAPAENVEAAEKRSSKSRTDGDQSYVFLPDANLSAMNKEEVVEWARAAQSQINGSMPEEDVPDGVGLPNEIARWLTIYTGRKHTGKDIRSCTYEQNRVVYLLQGNPEVRGITLKTPGGRELVSPATHQHEFRQKVSGADFLCSCGEKG
tara:strand:+ start:177 stop:668 length:492 start_codon:yes stop_codon:yes gene_type:complete